MKITLLWNLHTTRGQTYHVPRSRVVFEEWVRELHWYSFLIVGVFVLRNSEENSSSIGGWKKKKIPLLHAWAQIILQYWRECIAFLKYNTFDSVLESFILVQCLSLEKSGYARTLFVYYAADHFRIFGSFSLTHRSLRCLSGGAPWEEQRLLPNQWSQPTACREPVHTEHQLPHAWRYPMENTTAAGTENRCLLYTDHVT